MAEDFLDEGWPLRGKILGQHPSLRREQLFVRWLQVQQVLQMHARWPAIHCCEQLQCDQRSPARETDSEPAEDPPLDPLGDRLRHPGSPLHRYRVVEPVICKVEVTCDSSDGLHQGRWEARASKPSDPIGLSDDIDILGRSKDPAAQRQSGTTDDQQPNFDAFGLEVSADCIEELLDEGWIHGVASHESIIVQRSLLSSAIILPFCIV
jgi:hypothetical protein